MSMRKYHEKLYYSSCNASCGNHDVTNVYNENGVAVRRIFRYHGSAIVVMYPTESRVIIDNHGYSTISTSQAIKGYLELLPSDFAVEYGPNHSGRKWDKNGKNPY